VKLSTLLQVIGSGSVLLVVGVALVALGIGYGFHEATQLPLWACLCLIGLFIAVAGFVLVDRGSEEAEEKIEKELPPVRDFFRHPWFMLGASVAGGFLLQRIFRGGRSEVVVENIIPVNPNATGSTPSQTAAGSAEPSTTDTIASGVSHYVGDQLRTLATMATGAAATLGMKALGIPPVEQLIGELLGSDETSEKTADSGQSYATDQGGYQGWSRAERATTRQHSPNGANYPGEFDATRE